jgi:exodeoxyribonuclease VII large subunit
MQLDLSFDRPEPDPVEEKSDVAPQVLSVTELTRKIRETLERQVGEVWVRGEISNYRRQASGHHYFTLKDAGSQLSCVLFAGAARSLRGLRLGDGLQVQALGELTVYEARGQYQLVVQLMQEEGLGALQARFEALKARLAAEGLFNAERKRRLPGLPMRIGVVTSPTGAAIRDFLKVLHRRMPAVEVIIHPVRVQGRGAAGEIAAAVTEFSHLQPLVDLIVVTRGGGSLEDLWEFNEEVVARAIATSPIPVVSAVGHEIDFTLSDFAADFRAPTPSAAAELIVPDVAELLAGIAQRGARMLRECQGAIRFQRSRLAGHERSVLYRETLRILRERTQQLDFALESLRRGAGHSLQRKNDRLRHASAVIAAHRPASLLAASRGRLAQVDVLLGEAVARKIASRRETLRSAVAMLQTLSPDATLARGYSITFDGRGAVIRSAQDLQSGDVIRSRFRDGEADSVVQPRRDS